MSLVNEKKAKNSGQETLEISKQDEHEQMKHGQQETTKIHEEGDQQETTDQKKADKPADQPKPNIVDEVDKKGDEQKQVCEIDEHGQLQTTDQIHKGDKLKATSEQKPDEQPKATEQKPDEQPKATKQKRDERPKATKQKRDGDEQPKATEQKPDEQKNATEHEKPNKKQKVTEHKPMVYKVDERMYLQVSNVNWFSRKMMKYEACTSEGPINEHKPDESNKHDIKFQGDLYNFVPSPRRKYRLCNCYACGKHIKFSNSLYHCEAKERYLHPFCCKLNPMIRDVKQSYTLVESSPIICKWCKIKDDNGGLSYVSTTKDLRFHVYCFMELIKDKNNDNHVVKGLKTEAFLEATLSLTNIAIDGLTGGGIYSMFSSMIVPQ